MKLIVPDLSCSHCVGTVTQAVKAVDPNATVNVDLSAKTLSASTSATIEVITAALARAGYPSRPA